jgi:uncharacterized delta-60 repeat protein
MKRIIGFLISPAIILTAILVACNPSTTPQPTQDFELIPALETIELSPGGETSLWIKLDRSEGFSDTVRMFLESLPAGVSQRWSRDTENGDCTLILSADEFVTPGKYSIDLLGEIQSISSKLTTQGKGLKTQQTGQLNLVIIPTFLNLSLQPSILNVPRNSQTGMLVSVFGLPAPTADTTSFSLQGAPSGVIASFGALTTGSSFMTLSVSPTTPLGDHTFSVKVTTATATKLVPVSLTVTAEPANPNFKFLTSALSLKLNRTDTKPIRAFITRIKGFNQPITLSLDTSGTTLTGVTAAAFQIRAAGLQGSLNISSNNATPLGQALVTKVKATAGAVVKERNLTITINLTPGSLDTSFGTSGIVQNVDGDIFTLLPNDKIVTATLEGNLVVRRFNVNGSLDTTFDVDGSIAHPNQGMIKVTSIKVLPDNTVIIAGNKAFIPNPVVVVKLKANGKLDTSFGGDGVFIVDMPNEVGVRASAVLTDGKIIVGGDKFDDNLNATGVTLIRILADGSSVDTSFGTVTFSDLKISGLNAINLQADGKIILAGHKGSGDEDAVVGRLLSNGTEDSSFEGGFQSSGKAFGELTDTFSDLALDTSQRVIALGKIVDFDGSFIGHMSRFKTNARLDDSFAGNGNLTLDDSFLKLSSTTTFPLALTVQRDDKPLLLINTDITNFENLLVRLTTAGALDTSFAGTGKVTLPIAIDRPLQVEVDSQGRIVVLGFDGIARFVP